MQGVATGPRRIVSVGGDAQWHVARIGFAKMAGYDYPDRAIGRTVCPAPKASTRVYGVAKPPASVDDPSWRLVVSRACDRPSWMNDVSWLGSGDAAHLPGLSDLPQLE